MASIIIKMILSVDVLFRKTDDFKANRVTVCLVGYTESSVKYESIFTFWMLRFEIAVLTLSSKSWKLCTPLDSHLQLPEHMSPWQAWKVSIWS